MKSAWSIQQVLLIASRCQQLLNTCFSSFLYLCNTPVRYAVPLEWGQPALSNHLQSSLSRWWTAKDSWSFASTAAETVHLVHSLLAGICNKEVPAWQINQTAVTWSSSPQFAHSNHIPKRGNGLWAKSCRQATGGQNVMRPVMIF